MTTRAAHSDEFAAVVAFHGCYCLDIALGYRVAQALMREMGAAMHNLKEVVAYIGAPTCAVDAIQRLTGCTLGKRNLHYTNSGKSTFVLHNTVSGKAVRAYCHYWDDYDHEALRRARKEAADPVTATAEKKRALQALLDTEIHKILSLPEEALFRLTHVQLAAPPRFTKYRSAPCAACDEHAKHDLLVERDGRMLCSECAAAV